jgi:hypothetical protein
VNIVKYYSQDFVHCYFRHEVLAALTTDILCPEMSEQFISFLLPFLSTPQTMFPFSHLVETILLMYKTPEGGGTSVQKSKPSPWLLYAVLVLAEAHLGN